ncbi:thioredoxin (plasmid) [Halorientalis pallida]|uniref:thioredoxin n=1 Tax=Halorientalis pallida TaxID=2479928 RepID=UPI003C700C30
MTDTKSTATETDTQSAGHVESVAEFDDLIATDEPVLVDFYADWCGPCQSMSPVVDELAAERAETVVKVDIESLPQIPTRYGVRSIPTFLVFEDGEVEHQVTGVVEKHALADLLE